MWKNGRGIIIKDFKQQLIKLIKHLDSNKKIVVGCDSQVLGKKISFVTVVVIINVGKGASFLYKKEYEKNQGKLSIMENRLFQETLRSVNIAKHVDQIVSKYNLHVDQIHSDINPDKKYKSNRIASACIGFVSSCGYRSIIKPDAYAASQTADSLTR